MNAAGGALRNRAIPYVPAPWHPITRIAARAAILLAIPCAGCVVAGGGYGGGYGGGEVSYGYGVNYYEPFDNNGWYGPGYLVGPPRGGEAWRRDVPVRAYHGPSPDHATPTIPHGEPRGGRDSHP